MLHTDQHGTPPPLPQYPQFLNVTWTLTDYDRANGPLAIVPGSHRFGRRPDPYEADHLKHDALVPAIPVEVKAGSLIVWGGTTWHGSYPRTAPGVRLTIVMAFCRSYMKTIQDLKASIPPEVFGRNSDEFARFLGKKAPIRSATLQTAKTPRLRQRRQNTLVVGPRTSDKPIRRHAASSMATSVLSEIVSPQQPRGANDGGFRRRG